ncbi:MAG: hypothetical protein EA397_17180 [Deltaproteobacteria bacterium]|nr:MAG: hypothetical protein EA397_17180 [Deltaproteobacteria bacterium]
MSESERAARLANWGRDRLRRRDVKWLLSSGGLALAIGTFLFVIDEGGAVLSGYPPDDFPEHLEALWTIGVPLLGVIFLISTVVEVVVSVWVAERTGWFRLLSQLVLLPVVLAMATLVVTGWFGATIFHRVLFAVTGAVIALADARILALIATDGLRGSIFFRQRATE